VKVWKNEKCYGNMSCWQVFPQLLEVHPNLHELEKKYCNAKKKPSFFLAIGLESNAGERLCVQVLSPSL